MVAAASGVALPVAAITTGVAAGVTTVGTLVNALAKLSLSSTEQKTAWDVKNKLNRLMREYNKLKKLCKSLEQISADIQAILDKYIARLDRLAISTGNKLDDDMQQSIKDQVFKFIYNDVKVELPPDVREFGIKLVTTLFGIGMASLYNTAKVHL